MNIKKLQLRNTLRSLTVLTFAMVTLASCKKDEETTPKNPTIKYEIIPGAPFTNSTGLGTNYSVNLTYTNATGQLQINEQLQLTGQTTFTKEVVLTSTQRPMPIHFVAAGFTSASGTGTTTLNIYLDGVLKATRSVPIINAGSGVFYFDNNLSPLSFSID